MAGDCCNHFCYRLKSLGNDELDEGEEITEENQRFISDSSMTFDENQII
jgi:hypothetical protein